jgi:hypothetical protein
MSMTYRHGLAHLLRGSWPDQNLCLQAVCAPDTRCPGGHIIIEQNLIGAESFKQRVYQFFIRGS